MKISSGVESKKIKITRETEDKIYAVYGSTPHSDLLFSRAGAVTGDAADKAEAYIEFLERRRVKHNEKSAYDKNTEKYARSLIKRTNVIGEIV